jgi:hypothetical protein
LLKQRGELIALEARLAALDIENSKLEGDYKAALSAITGRNALNKPEVAVSQHAPGQNGDINNKLHSEQVGGDVNQPLTSPSVHLDVYTDQYGLKYSIPRQQQPRGGDSSPGGGTPARGEARVTGNQPQSHSFARADGTITRGDGASVSLDPQYQSFLDWQRWQQQQQVTQQQQLQWAGMAGVLAPSNLPTQPQQHPQLLQQQWPASSKQGGGGPLPHQASHLFRLSNPVQQLLHTH